MSTKNIFTQEHLEKIMNAAIERKAASMKLTSPASEETKKTSALKIPNQNYKMTSPIKKYLPYSLNYKAFEKLVLVLIATLTYNFNAEAFILTPRPRMSDISKTEASTSANTECRNCARRTSGLSPLPLNRAVASGPERIHKVAIFDEDKRQAISDLRLKDPSLLTAEEKMILQAASRTGLINCANAGTNGTLIKLPNGQDAVLTSAHAFLDDKGQPKCDLTKVQFYPNFTFNTSSSTLSEYSLTEVNTASGLPLNLENVQGKTRNAQNDFLIFPLSKNISDDKLADGSTRGYMRFDTQPKTQAQVYFIGNNNNFRGGFTSGYEKCNGIRNNERIYYSCATTGSSSSSPIVKAVNDEMVLTGIHRGDKDGSDVRPTPSSITELNFGVPIENVTKYLGLRSTTSNQEISI